MSGLGVGVEKYILFEYFHFKPIDEFIEFSEFIFLFFIRQIAMYGQGLMSHPREL